MQISVETDEDNKRSMDNKYVASSLNTICHNSLIRLD
jgi:hypothetical protein